MFFVQSYYVFIDRFINDVYQLQPENTTTNTMSRSKKNNHSNKQQLVSLISRGVQTDNPYLTKTHKPATPKQKKQVVNLKISKELYYYNLLNK